MDAPIAKPFAVANNLSSSAVRNCAVPNTPPIAVAFKTEFLIMSFAVSTGVRITAVISAVIA